LKSISTVWLFTQCFGQRLFVFDRATRVGRNNHRALRRMCYLTIWCNALHLLHPASKIKHDFVGSCCRIIDTVYSLPSRHVWFR
ncbi:hypothetical protein, partial [Nitrosomonas communis]|uniref:hypothetical protein n=1 Tax=Nitrosomonas communis TaxID=44574 RepID=UPI003D2DCF09